ncbi:MAG: hypothetical protein AAGH17_07215, partial [Pseudomonadota bacterium]
MVDQLSAQVSDVDASAQALNMTRD